MKFNQTLKRFVTFLLSLTTIFCIFLFCACTNEDKTVNANYEVVPLPRQIIYQAESNPFVLDKSTRIFYIENDSQSHQLASFLAAYINECIGVDIQLTTKKDAENIIEFQIDTTLNTNPDYYKLSVTPHNILINGAGASGVFYAIQTLRKSLPVESVNNISFPAAVIEDYPQFSHRGVSLDVSRHFYSADFIKKYIDVLALFNMNVFHWHLTDDQGWRIEIKKYPNLTKIGAQRSETATDRHSEEYDGKPYGGFYTQEEIKDVVEYARQRYITVIPEIDIPGHTLAVLASYPELGCIGGPYQVGRGWGIFEDVLCAGNDSVFTFLDDVFTEVAELFPAKYIHIGGDECLKNRWMACPKCQARIKALGIRETKAHSLGEQLQSYFIHRVEELINKKGKSIIGWDEILEGGIAPNATIMSWRGTDGGIYAAGRGHDVIMTPESHLYLDYYQSPDVDNEPYTFGWLTDLEKVYSFDPIPVELEKDQQKNILGGQVNVWTEYMPTSKNVEYMLLPRLGALAETLWSYPQEKDYNNFVARMYRQSLLLDKLGYENCKQAYGVQTKYDYDTDKSEIKVALSTFDTAPIYYTLDGTVPTEKSLKYSEPIIISKSSNLKALVVRDGIQSKIYSKEFSFNKATAKPIELKNQPDKKYTFNGAITLVDGQEGYKNSYRTGLWLGFLGEDMVATIRLGGQTAVSSVRVNQFINSRGGLLFAKSIKIEVSDDGKTFREVGFKTQPILNEHIKPQIFEVKETFDTVKANYIRVTLEAVEGLPAWHEKAGAKAYIMVDEIVVE
ncbi:family 20 glycosylhydrolase [Dysgonomonas sp. HDW5B]|uniref:glycoside hydrolase family 20 protein n=1 Tax=Dysgonomonas sp. HDW5B TaxID=2714927 RepID=UPI001408C8DD|nr:glycoside hydrolase family 20 protein [Dysgonomonas sp. HDW5B]QIK56014.1 family 20 glycosylhydrolase [Dysgonomonas sp. HDW5B]